MRTGSHVSQAISFAMVSISLIGLLTLAQVVRADDESIS